MVPMRYVDRFESFTFIQAERANVSSRGHDGRFRYACHVKHLCGTAEQVAADALIAIPVVHGKEPDAGGSAGIRLVNVKREVADRRIVAFSDEHLIRVAADTVFNPGGVQLVASSGVETVVGVKARIAVRGRGDVAKGRNIAGDGTADVAADVAASRFGWTCQRHAHADELKASRLQMLDRCRVIRCAEKIQTVDAMRPAPVEDGVQRRCIESLRDRTRDRDAEKARIPRNLFTGRGISGHRQSRPLISSARHLAASANTRLTASPPRRSARSSVSRAISWSSASATASALVAQTSRQVSAGLDASRVVSTSPRPARRSALPPAQLPMTSIRALAVSCGRWLRNAITRSCSVASIVDGRARTPRANSK